MFCAIERSSSRPAPCGPPARGRRRRRSRPRRGRKVHFLAVEPDAAADAAGRCRRGRAPARFARRRRAPPARGSRPAGGRGRLRGQDRSRCARRATRAPPPPSRIAGRRCRSTFSSRPTISRTIASWLMSSRSRSPTRLPSRSTTTRSAPRSTSFSRCEMKITQMPCGLEAGDDLSSLSVSAIVQARGRLVQDHQPRLERQRLGDLDDLLLREREPRHHACRAESRAEAVEIGLDASRRSVSVSTSCRKPPVGLAADIDVGRNVQVVEQVEFLVDEGDAGGHRVRAHSARGARRRRSRSCRESGSTTPPRIFIRVDLPAPFSPTRPITSPRRDLHAEVDRAPRRRDRSCGSRQLEERLAAD